MERKEEAEKERLDWLRAEERKSKKNKSGMPYNMISLMSVRHRVTACALMGEKTFNHRTYVPSPL